MNILKLLSLLFILILCLGTFSAESAGAKARRRCCCKMKRSDKAHKRIGRHSKKHCCRPCGRNQFPQNILLPGPLPQS
ncbi:protein GPR15L-like [Sceloporus undulatus]|uniref:protein GPR15L-like n=1 Tax=Sceloporus undulatus TaxID=8520 RepID=UPI001C4ABC35|nr:protein GPR15L-like [Sceloporus undulatus]